MHILSDYHKDVRSANTDPGAYEWWYFDGIDSTGTYSFVIIFYEGNPFSTRYIHRLRHQNHSGAALPGEYPAASISIYKNQQPIYYSFTEFEKQDCHFNAAHPRLRVGEHSVESCLEGNNITYELNLNEELPSGDALRGTIIFSSPQPANVLLQEDGESSEGHRWNLVQPRAEFTAHIAFTARGEKSERLHFEGKGYHDHNTGSEPMHHEFKDWYWGRFHFETGTLIYYIMERKQQKQYQAWLISPDNTELLATFPNVELLDQGMNFFGMSSARKLTLSNENSHVTIQQTNLLDNGPFYQRFYGDAFLNIPGSNTMQVSAGITEYIRPDRINWRLFWPLVNMRIQYKKEKPHWVQRSKRLYRWTW